MQQYQITKLFLPRVKKVGKNVKFFHWGIVKSEIIDIGSKLTKSQIIIDLKKDSSFEWLQTSKNSFPPRGRYVKFFQWGIKNLKLSTTVLSARLLIGSRFTPSQILALKPKTETRYKLDLEGHMEPTQKDFTSGPSDLSNFLHCKCKNKN